MQRNTVHRYRHQNTSLPEDLRSASAFTTHEMVLSTRESVAFEWSTEVISPEHPGRMGYFSKSIDLMTDGGPRGDDSDASFSVTASIEVQTEAVQTVTADAGPLSVSLASVSSASFFLGSPQSGAVQETLPTSSVSPTTPINVVNEGTSTVPTFSSSMTPSTTVFAYTGGFGSSQSLVSTTMTGSNTSSPRSTAQQTYAGYGSLTCDNGQGCAAMERSKDSQSGMIAGAVIGAVAGIALILAAFMLWRRKRKRVAKRPYAESDSVWHKLSRSDGATSTATDVGIAGEQKNSRDRDLGEPGPSFDFGEISTTNPKTISSYSVLQNGQKTSQATWSRNSLDRFYPTAGTKNDEHNTRSKIGIALTRYSTTDSAVPLSRPFTLTNCPTDPTVPKENIPQGHKRHSSVSAQSDATIRQKAEVVYVGKARTARRHSLTPRVINIVAAGGSCDQLDLSRNNSDSSSSAQDNLNRDSIRSRSMSPNKMLSGNASFVNGLSDRLNTKSSDEASPQNDQINRSSTTKTASKDLSECPMIPTRGRSMKRRADQHISYSNLGKTMSEVKRTIREKGDSAFASSDDLWDQARTQGRRSGGPVSELPSTVTVTRGGRGK